jgi:hypothetical protein
MDAGQADIPAFINIYTLHPCASIVLYDIENSYVNAGMPEKSLPGIGIFTGSQLLQSGNGIPASGSVRYTAGHGLVRHYPALLNSGP